MSATRLPRILVVDDHPVNLRVIEIFLQKQGFQVEQARNGNEAVDAIAGAKIPFDLVIMDCHMPGMTGIEATEHIRRRETAAGGRRLPILALTASTLDTERAGCLAAGMDDFLTKPVNFPQLLVAIKRLIDV